MKHFNIKKYEKDIREANRKRGYPGRYHGFRCIAVQYQERDKEWSVTLATPFGEGEVPIGKEGMVEYIVQRFGLMRKAFWEQKLKQMSQVEDKKGTFWRVTLKVSISPGAAEAGVPNEEGGPYLTVDAVQKILDESVSLE